MAIPKKEELHFYILQSLSDGQSHNINEIENMIAARLGITQEEREQVLANGNYIFHVRIAWACGDLKKTGMVKYENNKRGYYCLTEKGKQALLKPKKTPSERIAEAYREINNQLAEDLLCEIMSKDSDFFEELVIKLLLKMGYGGSVSDAGFKTQKTNDGGIDGVIWEDKLGFDKIYIQAKRWEANTSINRPEIQKFAGALQEVKASKGLFITTAKFSQGAKESAERQHIVLVDGNRLTKLMIEYNLGVSPLATYEIKAIDLDFFNNAE